MKENPLVLQALIEIVFELLYYPRRVRGKRQEGEERNQQSSQWEEEPAGNESTGESWRRCPLNDFIYFFSCGEKSFGEETFDLEQN